MIINQLAYETRKKNTALFNQSHLVIERTNRIETKKRDVIGNKWGAQNGKESAGSESMLIRGQALTRDQIHCQPRIAGIKGHGTRSKSRDKGLLQSRPLPDLPVPSFNGQSVDGSSSSLIPMSYAQDDLTLVTSSAGLTFLSGSNNNNSRWMSRENLTSNCSSQVSPAGGLDADGHRTVTDAPDPQLFVALYEFQSGGENQLPLRKGEQITSDFLQPQRRVV